MNRQTSSSTGLARIIAIRLLVGIVVVVMLTLVGVGAASALLHSKAPEALAGRVHHWITMARPYVLLLQLALLSLVWHRWPAIIRRARFVPAVETAWLAARDRMFYWGLAMIGLSVFLWNT